MNDMPENTELTSEVAEGENYRDLKENGQQKAYVVLSQEERRKGFVRPYRTTYVHRGHALRGTLEMLDVPKQFQPNGKVYAGIDRFEIGGSECGSYLTQAEVDQINRTGYYGGCGAATTMGRALAETYARDPKFYGATFCVGCGTHLPLNEFVWDGTNEIVGS